MGCDGVLWILKENLQRVTHNFKESKCKGQKYTPETDVGNNIQYIFLAVMCTLIVLLKPINKVLFISHEFNARTPS